MKIATYNVWNENKGFGTRFNQLIHEINTVDADIIALQEVTTKFYEEFLSKDTIYKFHEFRKYTHEDEGLAILSKYEFTSCTFLNTIEAYANSQALNVEFQVGKSKVSLTDVHLPWDSIKAKEEQTMAIDQFIHEQKGKAEYFILLGDFNTGINSSVHRYLIGEQTINGKESKPYWVELSETFSELHNQPMTPTLDFNKNPRWKGKNTMSIPDVDDRIYILDNWSDVDLNSVNIFGTEVSPENGLCASDHYGVVADITIVE